MSVALVIAASLVVTRLTIGLVSLIAEHFGLGVEDPTVAISAVRVEPNERDMIEVLSGMGLGSSLEREVAGRIKARYGRP